MSDEQWRRVHAPTLRKLHPGDSVPVLRCRDCGWEVRARVSVRGLRHFAHKPAGPQNCPSARESPIHLALKALIVECCVNAGWEAQTEVSGENWRADVLAKDEATGRHFIFEIQLSSQGNSRTDERTRFRTASGADVVWITTRRPSWAFRQPTLSVLLDNQTVYGGIYRPLAGCCGWECNPPVDVQTVVTALLSGDLIVHRVDRLTIEERWGKKTRFRDERDAVVWTSARRLARERAAREAAEDAERRREAAAEWNRKQHEMNFAAWLERRAKTVARMVLLGAVEVDYLGDRECGRGTQMILGDWRSFFIVVPVASQVTPRARRYFSESGTVVVAADDCDAARLRRVLPHDVVKTIDSVECSQSKPLSKDLTKISGRPPPTRTVQSDDTKGEGAGHDASSPLG